MPVLHPKFLQCFGICTHPCNLSSHTDGLTPFHPPLDTTTLAIVVDGMQRVCQTTKRGFKDFPGFPNNTRWLGPKRGRKCYMTPAF